MSVVAPKDTRKKGACDCEYEAEAKADEIDQGKFHDRLWCTPLAEPTKRATQIGLTKASAHFFRISDIRLPSVSSLRSARMTRDRVSSICVFACNWKLRSCAASATHSFGVRRILVSGF